MDSSRESLILSARGSRRRWSVNEIVFPCCSVQSDKLSSPVGSLMEGLNKEPTSESTFSTRISSVPAAAESQTSADGNASTAQFRSPLLRQMMGNKLAAGCRPTSATNDVIMSAPSDTVASVSSSSTTAVEIVVDSPSQSDQQSSIHSESVIDEIAVCDEPLHPSPRIEAPTASTDLGRDETSDESAALKPVPVEVWTEESMTDSSLSRSYKDHDDDGLCVENEAQDLLPRPEMDLSMSDKPEKLTGDVTVDPSFSRSSGTDDRDELCVDDLPLEPSQRPEMDIDGSGKLEERSSVVDEDRDIDTMETSASEVKVDLSADTSKWNGVEKASDSPSTLLNGYPDDDMHV